MNIKTGLIAAVLCMLIMGTGAGYRSAADIVETAADVAVISYEVENEEILIDEALREAERQENETIGLDGMIGVEDIETGKDDGWEEDPDGSVLTRSGGVNYYFDQKETYYNLNMSGVVELAHSLGIEGEYWVREDGCKMLGDYIMIAANLDVHERGSLVPTSLGMGIVVDTGGFAYSNPTQVDIAVSW